MLQPPPPPTMDALFSSSLAVIVLVLLGALFFLGFISLYIRRFAIAEEFSNADDSNSYYRQVRPPAMNLPPPLPLRQPSCAAIHKGLDPAVIGSLPTRAYSGAAKYQMECPVCLSEFEEGETIKVIPHCRHVFHVQCIDKWLYSHVSCPVCRAFCAAH